MEWWNTKRRLGSLRKSAWFKLLLYSFFGSFHSMCKENRSKLSVFLQNFLNFVFRSDYPREWWFFWVQSNSRQIQESCYKRIRFGEIEILHQSENIIFVWRTLWRSSFQREIWISKTKQQQHRWNRFSKSENGSGSRRNFVLSLSRVLCIWYCLPNWYSEKG